MPFSCSALRISAARRPPCPEAFRISSTRSALAPCGRRAAELWGLAVVSVLRARRVRAGFAAVALRRAPPTTQAAGPLKALTA
jgi:hypothetical protein